MRRDHARPVRRRHVLRVSLAAGVAVVALGASVAIGLIGMPSLIDPSAAGTQLAATTATVPQPSPVLAARSRIFAAPSAAPVVGQSAAATSGTASGPTLARRFGEVVPKLPAQLSGYRWPLPHGRITLPFGPSPWGSRIVDGKLFHDGLDIATFCGDRVVAAHDGVVLAAGRHYDQLMGWVGDLTPYLDRLEAKQLWSTLPIVVVIDDGDGYRSIYAHFWRVVVHKGELVKAGQLIGYEGMTGRASGCHVHFGLFDPLETATFGIEHDVVAKLKVPALEIARIDPLLVLPARSGGSNRVSSSGGHELPPTASDATSPVAPPAVRN